MGDFPNKKTQFKTGDKQVKIARKGGQSKSIKKKLGAKRRALYNKLIRAGRDNPDLKEILDLLSTGEGTETLIAEKLLILLTKGKDTISKHSRDYGLLMSYYRMVYPPEMKLKLSGNIGLSLSLEEREKEIKRLLGKKSK